MPRPYIAALFIATALISPASAQTLSSPEALFQEYKQAWVQRNVPRFLATINFQQEALEELQRRGTATDGSAVTELAAKKERDLRSLLETRGFIATDIGTCEITKQMQIADEQFRLILGCTSPTSALLLPLRAMRFSNGWQVVRGG